MDDSVIATRGLTKHYGKLTAVRDVMLNVDAGRVFGLMGRNGAGKTSLIKMLLGLTPISAGSATVLGHVASTDAVKLRQRVGYVPEVHSMYGWMTVTEITRFTAAFYPTWDSALCGQLLDRFKLDPGKRVRELSRGMVAKLALTLALAHRPPLLVLDEPTGGLDAIVRKEFLESIVQVAADEGRTVLLSSHVLHDMDRVADRVALMRNGSITLEEDTETLKERVREIRVTFPDTVPDGFELPGALTRESEEHECLLVVEQFDPALLTDLRQRFPDATIAVRQLDLEEIFVAYEAREA